MRRRKSKPCRRSSRSSRRAASSAKSSSCSRTTTSCCGVSPKRAASTPSAPTTCRSRKPSPSSGGCSSPSSTRRTWSSTPRAWAFTTCASSSASAWKNAAPARLSLLVESFGFKNGIPGDADFVFDARSLPNPYWDPALRALTGRDPDVIRFLEAQRSVPRLADDILQFVADAHPRAPGREPPLSHHRHRLHRRPPPLGVSRRAHRRAARRTTIRWSPSATIPSARCAPSRARRRSPELLLRRVNGDIPHFV